MVDPIDLMLLQRFQDLGVERFGRSEVVTEGLFDDDPAPLAVTLSRKARGSKRGNRRTKETVGDREIEQSIACRARRLVQSRQMLAEPAIGLRIVEVTRQIAHPLREPLPCGLREFVEMELAIVGDEALHCVGEIRAPLRPRSCRSGRRRRDEILRTADGRLRGCRVPARRGAWSGHRLRRKSPSHKAVPRRRSRSAPWLLLGRGDLAYLASTFRFLCYAAEIRAAIVSAVSCGRAIP